MKMYAIIEIEGNDEIEILSKAKSIGHLETIGDDLESLSEMLTDDLSSSSIDWSSACNASKE